MSKPKVAFLLSGGCGGCDMAIVDLSDALVDIIAQLDIVFWAPTVTDVKYKDLQAMPDKSIDIGLHSGCIRMSENENMAKVMRDKCKVLVAYGICASLGGIQGMANMHTKEELLETAYKKGPSTDNPEGILPQTKCIVDGKYELELPEFLPYVKTLDQVVDVDYYLGGCPPHYTHVAAVVTAILTGNLPTPGSWITGGKAVCDVCTRNPASQGRQRQLISEIKRTIDGSPTENGCLLEEGYLCLGAISQGDCGGSCPRVNIPCRGCGGPIPGVKDFGMRAISACAALFDRDELVNKVPSPTKLFNRYSLPGSILSKKIGGNKDCKRLK